MKDMRSDLIVEVACVIYLDGPFTDNEETKRQCSVSKEVDSTI